MFYSQIILSRKGPLGKIWLAAHFEKKLSRQQIFSTDISASVNSVVNSNVPLALRVSGQLMLGIVRIYAKKLGYLVGDATEALYRMQLAYPSAEAGGGSLDLVEGGTSGGGVGGVVANVDDLRHFGQLHPPSQWTEEAEGEGNGDRWGWAFTATLPPSHALRHPSPSPISLQRKALRSPASSVSEVELRRGGVGVTSRRESAATALPSPSPLPRTSLLPLAAAPVDELPAFEDADLWPLADASLDMGVGTGDYSLSFSAPAQPVGDEAHEPSFNPAPAQPSQTRATPLVNRAEPAADPGKQANKRARSRAAVQAGPIELSERVVKQRLTDSQCILRSQRLGGGQESEFEAGDLSLAASAILGGAAGLERRVATLSAYAGVCEELRATLRLIEERLPPPFPPLRGASLDAVPTPLDARSLSQSGAFSVEAARGGVEALSVPAPLMSQPRTSLGNISFAEVDTSTFSHGAFAPELELPPPMHPEYRKASLSPAQVLQALQSSQAKTFFGLTVGADRRSAASLFQELLELHCQGRVALSQHTPYADIQIHTL
eukprot:gene26449-31966_t